MKIAVDIDGTITWSNVPVFVEECNKAFDLGISAETLHSLTDKEDFYALPEVAARLAQEEYFCDELAWIEFRERCLLEALVMDDAPAGVARLATFGDLAYYTARYSDEHEIQLEIEKASKQWLKYHGFINHHSVVFCDRIEDKIAKILNISQNEYILLIDDSYKRVLDVIEHIEGDDRDLLIEKLMLVALRANANELPLTDVHVIALPYWDEIDSIIERIEAHGRRTQTTAKYAATTKATRDANTKKTIRARYSTTTSGQKKA